MHYDAMFANYKRYCGSKDGMTSVITTVLIIAIVMGLIIGPYLTIIVPQQIKENEAEHLDEVEESFLDLRSAINQELQQDIPNMVMSTRIKLGTDDENLFVLGGSGDLEVNPSGSLMSIYSYYDPLSIYARGSGVVKYSSKNMYQADKTFIYETGGIIVSQKSMTVMGNNPNFGLSRRPVIRRFGIDTSFGMLTGGDSQLEDVFVINTDYTTLTINSARITWSGGNATFLNDLNIAGNPIEWSGNAASGTIINFTSSYDLAHGVEKVTLTFNADILDGRVVIELFTSVGSQTSGIWPVNLDTTAHPYDIEVPSENAKKFNYKNICNRVTTIKNIAASWTGSASLWKINIAGHGENVWSTAVPGMGSPVNINLTKPSIFDPGESAEVKLYFTGTIDNEELNVKFFTENSTNSATTKHPVNLNETYINASFSIVSLVTETGDRINAGGKSSKVIKTTLVSAEDNRYLWETGEIIVFEIITSNSEAWLSFLNSSYVEDGDLVWDYDNIGAFSGDYYIESSQISKDQVKIKIILHSVYKLDCLLGIIKVDIG